jgi:hypothetical protein
MLINLLNALMAGKRTPTAKDYIQDGLIGMWDGIENAGWGTHDPNATVWKDSTGSGYDFAVPSSGASFEDICLNLSNTSVSANLPEVSRMEFTIECVAKSTGTQGAWVWMRNPSWAGGALVGLQSQGLCYFPWYNIGRVGDQDFATVSVTWNAATQAMYKNATSLATSSRSIDSRNVLATIYIGEYNGNKKATMGCYSVRLYSRALTAAEIAANYAIDKERFKLP